MWVILMKPKQVKALTNNKPHNYYDTYNKIENGIAAKWKGEMQMEGREDNWKEEE